MTCIVVDSWEPSFVAGVVAALSTETGVVGWDGIMIATIAMYHPLATGVVGVLWGALKSGSLYMEAMTDTNRLTVEVLLAFFVLFVTVDYRKLLSRRSRPQKGA